MGLNLKLKRLTLQLSPLETELLLIMLKQCSHTTFTDLETRKELNYLKERVFYSIKTYGMPNVVNRDEFGDFS